MKYIVTTRIGNTIVEKSYSFDDKNYAHSSHLVSIMQDLDYLSLDLITLTAIPN